VAIRVSYTHGYDRALTLLRFIVFSIWVVIVLWAISVQNEILKIFNVNFSWLELLPDWLNVVITLTVFLGYFALAIYLHKITTNRWIGNLSAYLYIRKTLNTQISFRDAASIAWLFVPNETGKWYPMKEVLQVSPEFRKQYLFTRAAEIARQLDAESRVDNR